VQRTAIEAGGQFGVGPGRLLGGDVLGQRDHAFQTGPEGAQAVEGRLRQLDGGEMSAAQQDAQFADRQESQRVVVVRPQHLARIAPDRRARGARIRFASRRRRIEDQRRSQIVRQIDAPQESPGVRLIIHHLPHLGAFAGREFQIQQLRRLDQGRIGDRRAVRSGVESVGRDSGQDETQQDRQRHQRSDEHPALLFMGSIFSRPSLARRRSCVFPIRSGDCLMVPGRRIKRQIAA